MLKPCVRFHVDICYEIKLLFVHVIPFEEKKLTLFGWICNYILIICGGVVVVVGFFFFQHSNALLLT